MDGTSHLLDHLDRLLADVGGPPADLSRSLDALLTSLNTTIPSFTGLIVNVQRHSHPVTLTALDRWDGRAAATSLRWTIPHPGTDGETSLTLYAGRAGAFVDLAADLGYLLRGRPHLTDGRPAEDLIRLDRDLPPPSLSSGITGLEELSTINRATGVLIERGAHPQQAMRDLARHAAAAGLDHYTYARTLLSHLINPSDT
jgi:hypothetical protein